MARRLQADFDASLQELWQGEPWHQALVRTSRSGNSWKYYTLQLGLDPLLTMYEATRYEPYLQFALALCQNMVGAANQDRDGDGPPEWDGRRGEGPMPDPPDVLLQDFQGAGPIIRAARIVLTDRQLKAKYGPQATPLAHFVEQHIIHKWMYDRHQFSYWKKRDRWLDKMSTLVRMELDLYAISGDQKHWEMAKYFAERLAGQYTNYVADEDLYLWRTPSRDTQHANRHVTMAIYCYEAGLVYTRRDLQRITNTFLKRVWEGSLTQPRFNNYHDGSNQPMPGRPRGGYGWGEIYDGWIKLGCYDARTQPIGIILWEQVKRRQWSNPSAKQHKDPWAKMALPANLLYNLVKRSQAPGDDTSSPTTGPSSAARRSAGRTASIPSRRAQGRS